MKQITAFSGKNGFLSNFHVESDGRSVEKRFQAAKTNDPALKQKILDAPTEKKAKQYGRAVELRSDWEEVKDAIMFMLVWKKFQDPELRAKLLATGTDFLEEGNFWHDNYWGQCSCETHKGLGQNRLGFTLMLVRSNIVAHENGVFK